MKDLALTPFHTAPQHGPRPLPLFLEMLREQTAASPERRAAALRGLAAYQTAMRHPRPADPPVLCSKGRARVLDYGGEGTPVLFVPSLINPPFILDLTPATSLLRWLAGRGTRTLLLDWGTPQPSDRDMDLTAHVERILLPLIAQMEAPPVLVGYCLGGTIAAGAAAAGRVAGLAMIATPWRFRGFSDPARADIATLWARARPMCERLGVVPMEVLQSGFWRLDPAQTIAKYIAFAERAPDSDAARSFVTLEDWANAGAPLPYAVGQQLFEAMVADDLTGRGDWHIAGAAVDPLALPCPAIEFISTSDRIVPAASAAGLPDQRRLSAGHVGMIVGGRARDQLWQPLADWLSTVPGTR